MIILFLFILILILILFFVRDKEKFTNKPVKLAVLTYESRNLPKLLQLHNQNMRQYCAKYNYDYIFTNKYDNQLQLPVYWKKLQLVKDLLSNRYYDYVLWMDTDAFFLDLNKKIESIINLSPTSSIFIGKDYGEETFCSGVFIIKNNQIGRTFIDDCITHYINSPSCKRNGKYSLEGQWAGMCYEQGVMNFKINTNYKDHTYIFSENIVYNADQEPPFSSFIIHIFGDKTNTVRIINKILIH
jgi:hypothetical protein